MLSVMLSLASMHRKLCRIYPLAGGLGVLPQKIFDFRGLKECILVLLWVALIKYPYPYFWTNNKWPIDGFTIFLGYFWIIFLVPFRFIFLGIKISHNLCIFGLRIFVINLAASFWAQYLSGS